MRGQRKRKFVVAEYNATDYHDVYHAPRFNSYGRIIGAACGAGLKYWGTINKGPNDTWLGRIGCERCRKTDMAGYFSQHEVTTSVWSAPMSEYTGRNAA